MSHYVRNTLPFNMSVAFYPLSLPHKLCLDNHTHCGQCQENPTLHKCPVPYSLLSPCQDIDRVQNLSLQPCHRLFFFIGFSFKMLAQWNFTTTSTSSYTSCCPMHYIQIKGYIVGFESQSALWRGGCRRGRLHSPHSPNSQTGLSQGRKHQKFCLVFTGNLSTVLSINTSLKTCTLGTKAVAGTLLFMAMQDKRGYAGFLDDVLQRSL